MNDKALAYAVTLPFAGWVLALGYGFMSHLVSM